MSKKVYELSDLNNLKYYDICVSCIEVMGGADCVVEYGSEFYTTNKNIAIALAYEKYSQLIDYFNSIHGIGKSALVDLENRLIHHEFRGLTSLITTEYDALCSCLNDEQNVSNKNYFYMDILHDCVLDPDDEDKFLNTAMSS